MQGLAVGIVIDSTEGEIPEFEPDLVGRRDQAARPPDRGKMPDRQHRRGKGYRQQQGPQARPPCCHPRRLALRDRAIPAIGRERGHGQVGFTASTKLVSMKVEKSGSRLICFSASMWSA